LGNLFKATKGTSIKIIAVVHDKILLEADDGEANNAAILLEGIMESAGNEILSSVPCIADAKVADSWAEK